MPARSDAVTRTAEAKVIELYQAGLTLRAIADHMQHNRFRTSRGGMWWDNTVRRILIRNGVYEVKWTRTRMRPARPRHSEDVKARVYAALLVNGGNVKRTARETGINATTVRRWKRSFTSDPGAVVGNTASLAQLRAEFLWSRVVAADELFGRAVAEYLEAVVVDPPIGEPVAA